MGLRRFLCLGGDAPSTTDLVVAVAEGKRDMTDERSSEGTASPKGEQAREGSRDSGRPARLASWMQSPRPSSKNGTRELSPEDAQLLDQLRSILRQPKLLQQLIGRSMALHADMCMRLRFCSAVNEYQSTVDPAVKLAKARKIVAMFVQNGSMFQLDNLPRDLQNRQVWRSYHDLDALKNGYEYELISNERISAAIRALS